MSESENQDRGAAPPPLKKPTIIRPSQDGQPSVPARPAPARPAPRAPGGRAPPTVPKPPVPAGAAGTAPPPIPSRPGVPSVPSHTPAPAPASTKREPSSKDAGKNKSQGCARKRPEITIVDARPMSQAGFRDMKVPEVGKPASISHEAPPKPSSNGGLPAVPNHPPPAQSPQLQRPPPPQSRPSAPPPTPSPQSEDAVDSDAAQKTHPQAPPKPTRPTILRPSKPKPAMPAGENVVEESKVSPPPPLPKRSPLAADVPASGNLVDFDPPPKPARSLPMDESSPGEEKKAEDETDKGEDPDTVTKSQRGPVMRPRPRPKPSVEEGQRSVEITDETQEAVNQQSPLPRPRGAPSRPAAVVAGHPHDSTADRPQEEQAEHTGTRGPPVPAARPKTSPRGGPNRPVPPATASPPSGSPRLPEPLMPSKPYLPSSDAPPIPASHPTGPFGTTGHPPALPSKPPLPHAAAGHGALYAVSEPLGDTLDRVPASSQPTRPPPPVPKSRPQAAVPASSMAGRPLPTVPSKSPALSPSSPSSEVDNFYEDVDEVKAQVPTETVTDKLSSLTPENNQPEDVPSVEKADDIAAMYAKVNKPKKQSCSEDTSPPESAAPNPFGIKLKYVGPKEAVGSEETKSCQQSPDGESVAMHKHPVVAPKPKPAVTPRPECAPKPTSPRKEAQADTLANPPVVQAKPQPQGPKKFPPPDVTAKPEPPESSKPQPPDVAAKPELPEPSKPPPTAKRPTIIRPHKPAPESGDGGASEHQRNTQEAHGNDDASKVSETKPQMRHASSEKAETSPPSHRPPPPRPVSRQPPPKPSPPSQLQEVASSKPDSESAPPKPPSPAPPRPTSRPVKEAVSSGGEEARKGGERATPLVGSERRDEKLGAESEEGEVRTRPQPQRSSGPPPRPISMPPVKPHLSAAHKAHAASKSEKPLRPEPVRAPPSKEANKHLTPPALPHRPGLSHPLYSYMASQPHAIATHDYPAMHDDELPFQEGDTVVLLKRVDDQWLMGKVGDKEGIFPQNFVNIIHPLHGEVPASAMDDMVDAIFEDALQEKPDLLHGPRCRARFDFEGEGQTDLSFEDGDVIQLLAHCGGDWLKGELNGRQGIFPASFIEIIEDLPEETHEILRGTGSEVTALFDFSGEPGELSFQAGDKICILGKVNEQWLFGKCASGNQGSFPASFVDEVPLDLPLCNPEAASQNTADMFQSEQHKPTSGHGLPNKQQRFCTALHGFEKMQEGDLEFNEGDCIEILEEIGEDWLRGRLAGTEGIFPKSFVSFEDSGAGSSNTEDFSSHDNNHDYLGTEDFNPEDLGTGLDIHSSLVLGKALFDFEGQADTELTFKAGDEIVLGSMVSEDSEWQWGELHSKKGMFPANFVEMI